MRIALAVLTALLGADVAAAEETGLFRLGEAGVLKAALNPQLYLDGSPIADQGIVLEEVLAGQDYRWTDLPDVGSDDQSTYTLAWDWNDVGYSYVWPSRRRTMLSALTYTISTSPVQLTQGATVPAVGLTIRGLTEDPASSAVTYSMWSSVDSTRVLDDVAASIVSSGQEADGTWTLVVEHSWTALETGALLGEHYGRFRIVLPSSAVFSAPPPPRSLVVRIHALP